LKPVVAIAQFSPRIGLVERNLERHVELIDRAVEGGASMVVFPELSLTGYTLRDLTAEVAMRSTDPRLAPLVERSGRITIVAGGVEEGENFGMYNAAFLFEEGRITTHRKVYPPNYGLFEEQRYVLPGTRVAALDTRIGRIGILICEDIWHVSLPLLLALDGAQVIVVIAASPTRFTRQAGFNNDRTNAENNHAIARLLSTFLIYVNRTGYEDGVHFCGGSEIVSPYGEPLLKAPRMTEELLFAPLDFSLVRRARMESRHFLDERPEFLLSQLRRILGAG
jgi:predicted amidohydrolase